MADRCWRLRATLIALLVWLFLAQAAAPVWAGQEEEGSRSEAAQLFLELEVEREQTYLHQPLQVGVTLLVGQVQVRNIEPPRLPGPGVTPQPFGLPRQLSVVRQWREFTAYRFSTSITPTRPGRIELGPALLDCELLAPGSGPAAFFGETVSRRVTLRSPTVALTVLALPVEGRPAGFSGAVGRFRVTRRCAPATVVAGDPVTLQTAITGTGDAGAFSCGSVSGPAWKSYPPRRKLSGDTLTCEQVVIPEQPGAMAIPAAQIDFFDPNTGRYGSATSQALKVVVTAPQSLPAASRHQATAAPPAVSGAPAASFARPAAVPSAPPPGLPAQSPAVAPGGTGGAASPAAAGSSATRPGVAHPARSVAPALVAVLLLVAGGALLARYRLRSRDGSAERPAAEVATGFGAQLAAAQAALAEQDVENFYSALFSAARALVGSRLAVPPAGIASSLPPGALPAAHLQAANAILVQCDRVRYGRHRPDVAEMAEDLQRLRELVPACGAEDAEPRHMEGSG